jgi:hypothetical protein
MGQDAMHNEWVAMERHRLDVVGGWPPSPLKEATLAAIHSALVSLGVDEPPGRTWRGESTT